MEVAPEDEEANEDEVEEKAEGEDNPGQHLPGPPDPCRCPALSSTDSMTIYGNLLY